MLNLFHSNVVSSVCIFTCSTLCQRRSALAVVRCLVACVGHKSEFYHNSWTHGTSFGTKASFTNPKKLRFYGNSGISEMKMSSSETLSQTVESENFTSARRSCEVVNAY